MTTVSKSKATRILRGMKCDGIGMMPLVVMPPDDYDRAFAALRDGDRFQNFWLTELGVKHFMQNGRAMVREPGNG